MTTIPAITALVQPEDTSFSWKPNARMPIPANVAAAALRSIYHHDGVVTPEAVVDAARSKESPLHKAFEWDDSAAAEAYRNEQARYMIRMLVVVYRQDDEDVKPPAPIRYLVNVRGSVPDDDESAGAPMRATNYLPIERVMTSETLRASLVRQAYAELGAWARRYRNYSEFAALVEQIESLQLHIDHA